MPYKDPEKQKEQRKRYQKENREKLLAYAKKYREENKEKVRAWGKKSQEKPEAKKRRKIYEADYFEKNRDIIREKQAIYREKNREEIRKRAKERRERLRDEINVQARVYYDKKKSNPEFMRKKRIKDLKAAKNKTLSPSQKIAATLRNRINIGLKKSKKAGRTIELLGCTYSEVKLHLEKQFTEGMTWDNWGRGGWHIDHIKPCSSFDLTKEKEQFKCFHHSNLQPLWESDNCAKGDNIDWRKDEN